MRLSLAQIADFIGATVVGDGKVEVHGFGTLDTAKPGEITFIDSADKVSKLATSQAAAAIVPMEVSSAPIPILRSANVVSDFTAVALRFQPPRAERRIGVHPQAIVSPTAKIGRDVDIHPGATVGDDVELGDGVTIHSGAHVMAGCVLAEGVTLYPGVVLYPNTRIGKRSTIHSCAVLGANGFGYRLVDGRHQAAAQIGYVEIGEDVEVGANSTIDRGTYGPTTIGDGTKIDNLVQIGHNCRIGRHNLICGQVGIAGSCTTGEYVVMAGGVGVRDHVHIGDRAVLGAFSGVANDVPAGAAMLGIPAIPLRDQKLQFGAIAKLPQLRREFKALQQAVAELQARGSGGAQAAA